MAPTWICIALFDALRTTGCPGRCGLAALEPTRDLLHGNEPVVGGGAGGTTSDRACYGCFERW